ncbi:protein-tyrosine phosphatase, partial [Baffinella frigidus]
MGSYYIPPVNFGLVEDNLYRSGQPNELNFPFLEKLRLKKILYLSPEPPPQAFQAFVNDQGIDLQQLGGAGEDRQSALSSPMPEEASLGCRGGQAVGALEPNAGEGGGAGEDRQSALWSPMSEEVVLQALQQILDTENHYPLCLMDSVGRNRVGIVV